MIDVKSPSIHHGPLARPDVPLSSNYLQDTHGCEPQYTVDSVGTHAAVTIARHNDLASQSSKHMPPLARREGHDRTHNHAITISTSRTSSP